METFKTWAVFVVLILIGIALYNQRPPPGPPGVRSDDA